MGIVEVETNVCMPEEGEWELAWTPPYMPSFPRMELSWRHARYYVNFNYEAKRVKNEAYVEIEGGLLRGEGGERPGQARPRVRDGGRVNDR